MKLLRGLHNKGLSHEGCVATIGNFDGVHKGHQSVIRLLRKKADELGLPAVVIVFEPQPLEFFKGAEAPARILSFRDKFDALKHYGVDAVFCLKFDETLSRFGAGEFVSKVLVDHLHIRHLVVGDDFRFGSDRAGDFNFLVDSGAKLGFSVENTPTEIVSGPHEAIEGSPEVEGSTASARVSSTRIRQALADGHFELVERLVGRPYEISGRVLHGQKLGRTLGFATANLALKRRNIALQGVYAVRVCLSDGRDLRGVANIGVKPTVGDFKANLEVHLFDFEGDLYGQRLRVRLVAKIRDEQKFSGLDELKQRIALDAEQARTILAL